MREPWHGHKYGAEKVEQLLFWCKDLNIHELTLYALSTENLNRPKTELNFLMNLFEEEFEKLEKDKRVKENGLKIRFIGQRELLSKKLREIMKRLEDITSKNKRYLVNIALAYGGRYEIINAIKRIINKKQKVTEKNFEENLELKSAPDIIIRTGGEKRTSNFLPWQAVYSEWFFLNKMWPEFTKQDLKKIISEFHSRERRFGK